MARLTIPRGVRKSLVALATVSSEQTEQLIETLSSLSPNLSPEEIPEQLASKLTQWDSDQARETIQAILGLCALRAQTGQKPETLVADVILTLKRDTGLEDSSTDGKAVVVLAPENEERLRNSLLRLFSITVLDVTAKALGVLTDNQRSFVSARILSDMRPIFKDDISARSSRPTVANLSRLA